jgi:hypothetical protein
MTAVSGHRPAHIGQPHDQVWIAIVSPLNVNEKGGQALLIAR